VIGSSRKGLILLRGQEDVYLKARRVDAPRQQVAIVIIEARSSVEVDRPSLVAFDFQVVR
jgi:hypothetical protein